MLQSGTIFLESDYIGTDIKKLLCFLHSNSFYAGSALFGSWTWKTSAWLSRLNPLLSL